MNAYILSPLAEDDAQEIWDYIAQDSSEAADKVLTAIRDGARKIAEFPNIGHRRADIFDVDVLVWRVYAYLIIYRPQTKPLEIVRIIHGMRDVPALFDPNP